MFVKIRDIDIHVQRHGPPGAAPLVLLHSLGTSGAIFEAMLPALSRYFHVIVPDLRGHGLSSGTPGPYSAELLADDVLALLEGFGIEQAHLAGISIGGLIAQAAAARAPQRLASLTLIDTALRIPPPEGWRERAALVRTEGIATIEAAALARWVTPGFAHTPQAAGLRAMLTRTPAEFYAAACEAIAAADFSASTAALDLPALVLVGAQDESTPPEAAAALHRAIPGSVYKIIADAAHLPVVEQPQRVAEAMLEFLLPANEDSLAAGMAVRKAVLGEAHVARATAAATSLDRDFQAFITRTAWGGVWARPGLDRRTRSLLTIAMMASLGHEEELKLHLHASRNTGATPEDIAEVLLQVGVYAGIPAANSAFRHAKTILQETP